VLIVEGLVPAWQCILYLAKSCLSNDKRDMSTKLTCTKTQNNVNDSNDLQKLKVNTYSLPSIETFDG